jgi:hypothetical protein
VEAAEDCAFQPQMRRSGSSVRLTMTTTMIRSIVYGRDGDCCDRQGHVVSFGVDEWPMTLDKG